MIPFNKPAQTKNELFYIQDVLQSGRTSGDGKYTKLVHKWFENSYGFNKCLLTTSCTDALEMCATLLNIGPGDEVIIPSYTFVSSALPFISKGATIVFCDSEPHTPHQSIEHIESLITPATKAVVAVHYAGAPYKLLELSQLCQKHNIYLIEDAAQAIDSSVGGISAGSVGSLATFSFHESKNIACGEGGLLVINDENLSARAEIIREKGTNRSSFFRGEIDKYGWVELGSSYLASDVLAALLYSQLESKDELQAKRLKIWSKYFSALEQFKDRIILPYSSIETKHNGHIFYLVLPNNRDVFMRKMAEAGVHTTFHYQSLHDSKFFKPLYSGSKLTWSDYYTENLVRLPIYSSLTDIETDFIIENSIRILRDIL